MTVAATVDLTRLSADLAAASGQSFQNVATGLVAQAANQVQEFAKAYVPVRTGELKESIGVEVQGLSATITAASDHAAFVEFGTGTRGEFPGAPIVINAKPGKVLSWVGSDGIRHFAKRVVSPGMAPRPFMRPAVERIALPLANSVGNNAVIAIVHGPNNPETLQNAPATGGITPPVLNLGLDDRAKLVASGSLVTAKSAYHAKKAFK